MTRRAKASFDAENDEIHTENDGFHTENDAVHTENDGFHTENDGFHIKVRTRMASPVSKTDEFCIENERTSALNTRNFAFKMIKNVCSYRNR